MIQDTIISIAKTYIGNEEIKSNQGFKDKGFESEMKSVGWYVNGSWCAFLGILIWTKSYENYPKTLAHAKRLFSGNSQEMARNFHADASWPTSTNVPKVGSLVIWGDGDSTKLGHTGIVIAVSNDGIHFTTIEGNTIPDGNPGDEREGYIVASHTHATNKPHSIKGLNLIRFIHAINEDV